MLYCRAFYLADLQHITTSNAATSHNESSTATSKTVVDDLNPYMAVDLFGEIPMSHLGHSLPGNFIRAYLGQSDKALNSAQYLALNVALTRKALDYLTNELEYSHDDVAILLLEMDVMLQEVRNSLAQSDIGTCAIIESERDEKTHSIVLFLRHILAKKLVFGTFISCCQ